MAGTWFAPTIVMMAALTRSRRFERIADAQLTTALHQEGLLAASQVKRAFIEPSGEISIIKNGDDG